MWWLFFIQSMYLPFTPTVAWLPTVDLRIMIDQFLLLGLIPGTNIVVTFNWFVVAAWVAFFGWIVVKAFPHARKTIAQQKQLGDIDLYSL